jgi:hypothetical protein
MLLLAAGPADAQALCPNEATDDALRPLPQSLVPEAKRTFGLRMPDEQVRRSTVFRCADGHVLLCNYGANLPCGKANTDRDPRGAKAWCHGHPDADFIPHFAIPSGNIYHWRCAAGRPEIAGQAEAIDPRGFVARYWRPLN